jgi:hypothetical protein
MRPKCLSFLQQYKSDIPWETNWQTTGHKQTSFTLHSTAPLGNETGIYTTIGFCISWTTGMELIGWKKIKTDYQKYKPPYLKFETGYFKILQPFRKPGNSQSDCVVQRKGNFQTIHFHENKRSGIKIYKPCNSTNYVWHKNST